MTAQAQPIIEGEFRVVATRVASVRKPFSKSPNRQRAVARIMFWNAALVGLAVVIPYAL